MEKDHLDISLGDEYQREVRPMLDLVNDLHRILQGHTKVPLPRIAVVGNQSSGKSSVLERLSSVQLPRASGLCTRVPLVLAMKKTHVQETVCKIEHEQMACKKISLSEVSKEILDATSLLAGRKNRIEDKSINLYVEASNAPELTLVDLPGIVYTPAQGQPEDISRQVRELILKHIRPKETLILCVFDGTTDIQASEALKLAREVDESGERTLGIITKIDRCEDASSLHNRIMQLGSDDMSIKLGLIALRNRTVHELKVTPNAHVREVAENEQDFFKKTAELSNTPSSHLGINSLTARLCSLQFELLKKVLPSVGERLRAEMHQGQKRLLQIKGCKTADESFVRVQRELDRLKHALRCVACGDYVRLDEMCPSGLRLVPDMTKVLEDFTRELSKKAPNVFDIACVQEAEAALSDTKGHGLPNFLSHEPFQGLMRKWHKPYDVIVMEVAKLVARLVRDAFMEIVRHVASTPLQSLFMRRIEAALAKQEERVHQHLKLLLEMETKVIDTLNNYYISTVRSLEQFSKKENDHQNCDRDGLCALISEGDQNVEEVKNILDCIEKQERSHDPNAQRLLKLQISAFCYNKVVRKRMSDQVMQFLRFYYIEYARNELGFEVACGVSKEQAHGILRSSPHEEAERSKLEAMVEACRQGIARIDDVGGGVASEATLRANDSSGVEKNDLPDWAQTALSCRPDGALEKQTKAGQLTSGDDASHVARRKKRNPLPSEEDAIPDATPHKKKKKKKVCEEEVIGK